MDIPASMQRTILFSAISLGGVGLFGAFTAHADLAVIAPTWAGLFVRLAKQSGHALEKDKALKIAGGVALGLAGFAGGVKLANGVLAYTGVGTVPAMLANASMNGVLTYLAGRAAAHTFLESNVNDSADGLTRSILLLLSASLQLGR